MSSNKALIIFVLFIWTVIGGYYFVEEARDPHTNHSHHKMTAKLSSGVQVHFKMPDEKDPQVNEAIDVVAEITSLAGSGAYEYKIFMPNNAELISPAQVGQIELENEVSQELVIRYSQSVEYDMKIHLEIRKPGSPNASMFTFSTLNFKKNQEEVDALQERQSNYSK